MKTLAITIVSFIVLFSFSCSSGSGSKEKSAQIPDSLNINDDSQFFSFLNLDYPGLGDVKKWVKRRDLEKAKIAYLDFRRNASKTKWFINPSEKPKAPVAYDTTAVSGIMKHYVRMGSYDGMEVFLGDDINWDINPLKPTDPDFDTQFTHSLHRLAFWNVLGKAYWATLNEKYAKEWIYQMTDWVKDNPVVMKAGPGNGPLGWWSLNPGIRMSNRGSWMNAYYYFLFSPNFTPENNFTLVKGVIEHAWRLLEVTVKHPEHVGNWVTMECNGLGTIGILFPEFKDSPQFTKVALDRMSKEIDKQVYPDGAQVELAPGYHQVSMVNFMDLAKVAQLNNVTLPEGFLERLKKMYEFNLYLMDPSGSLPPFNDAGRSRITSSLKEAFDVWKDDKFLFGASLGKEGRKPDFDSYFFNYAGYYAMRSGWNYNDNCLFFDGGPVGLAHQHEDMLNLFLYSRGKILITEPGTYSYDQSEWRRYVLSTRAHNTIIVDGKEQHRSDIPSSRLIKEPLKNPWVTSPLFDYGAGTYSSGYQVTQYVPVQYMPVKYVGKKDTTISHTRHVIFLRPWYYVAVDFLEGKGMHTYDAHFHLDAPDAKSDEKSMAVHTLRKDSVQLALFPMDLDGLKLKIVKGQENPILGWMPREHRKIPTIVYSEKREAPATFSTLIYPYQLKEPEVNYKKLMTGNNNLWGENINTPYESISLIIRRTGDNKDINLQPVIIPEFSVNADVILIRKPKDKQDIYFGFYNISNFKDKTLAFGLATSSSLVIMNKDNRCLIYNPQETGVEISFTVPLVQKIILSSKKWTEIKASGISETAEAFSLF